jgi:hypothetical protein
MVASLLTPLTNGIQDEKLFSRISFGTFIKQWKKTTRFATQWHRIDFNSIPDFGKTTIIDIPTKGHLVGRSYLVTTLPAITVQDQYPQYSYCHSVGYALLEDMQVLLGGRKVDHLNSRLLEIKDELGTRIENVDLVNSLIGRAPAPGVTGAASRTLYIHLPFWFSGNDPHLWYPIDAVNVDKLSVQVKFRSIDDISVTDSVLPTISNCKYTCTPRYVVDPTGVEIPGLDPSNPSQTFSEVELRAKPALGETYLLVEYIYLDTYEANRLRVSPIEIPIPQHVVLPTYNTGKGSTSARIPLRIGNPTKSIYFFAQNPRADEISNFFSSSTDPTVIPSLRGPIRSVDEPITAVALVYNNGQVRYQTTYMDLFRRILPALECTKAPIYNQYFYYMGFDVGNHDRRIGIPGGQANFDKLTGAELRLDLQGLGAGTAIDEYNIYIYAITYNILSIYGGRAGLLFAY